MFLDLYIWKLSQRISKFGLSNFDPVSMYVGQEVNLSTVSSLEYTGVLGLKHMDLVEKIILCIQAYKYCTEILLNTRNSQIQCS